MKSTDFLQAAIDVQNQRAAEYDSPGGERSMGRTVQAFNAITGRDLTEAEGWLLLQVLKDVRQWSAKGYHHDSALDGVAYSALKAEALAGAQRTDVPSAKTVPEVDRSGDPRGWKAGDRLRFNNNFSALYTAGDIYEVQEVSEKLLYLTDDRDGRHPWSFHEASASFIWVGAA